MLGGEQQRLGACREPIAGEKGTSRHRCAILPLIEHREALKKRRAMHPLDHGEVVRRRRFARRACPRPDRAANFDPSYDF